MIDRIREISINTEKLKMWIIEYRGRHDIDIEFENGYIAKNMAYGNFKKGQIKNLYYPNVYNIGYVGEGKYLMSINRKATIEYNTWVQMLRRCYDENNLQKFTTYKGCVVCKEWHNFQIFAKWFNENYYEIENEKMAIDKDILIKGNKIYSPETCVFVPERVNSLFVKRDKLRGKFPIGVSWNKKDKVFCAYLHKPTKNINLGHSDSPEKAFKIYKKAKEKYIKEVAEEYKNKIPKKLYEAMYRYEVEITD